MAASLSVNAMQVDFVSVLAMEHTRMVRMFKSLEETGIKGFMEVSNSVFEGAVTEFFARAKVITGTIVSFVANRKMVVTKDMFAEAFGLPTEGMALCAKAGSFDVVTSEKFDLMVAISAGLKVNWTHVLFQILIAMVHCPSRQSQGFVVQLSVLLLNMVKADLGESMKFHPLKTQTTQKQENKYEVKPQYEELSKQLIMQHAIINAMKCMRAIKDRIARPVYQLAHHLSQPLYPHGVSTGEIIGRPHNSSVGQSQRGFRSGHNLSMIVLDFSGTTHQLASHNVAFDQVTICHVNQARDISPGTANLKPSLTGHDNSAAKQLKHNFKTEENTYPKAYTNRGTLGQDFTESVERTGSSRFLKSTVPVSKLVSIGRETQEEFNATSIIQNNGGTRRKSTKECYGEQ
ncbi:hypothetical protein F511_31154 [Dorcoceras hygrometricum]|uniref:Uncharacterized protein n=1 Tax=Dorcoceras hygrometricum TaxID=472368 RepID=A0A2Z7AXA6_9LAMI|nr:hypothetical protein F511_31154 [Dorcoceras hygrometricum]